MNSELSNLALFFAVLGKVALTTGLLPFGVIVAIFVKCPFPFCVLRDSHDEDHDVQIPIEPFVAKEQLTMFRKFKSPSSGDGQLATIEQVFVPANENPATSPSRRSA